MNAITKKKLLHALRAYVQICATFCGTLCKGILTAFIQQPCQLQTGLLLF